MNVVVAFLTILENVLHSGVHRGGSSPLAPPPLENTKLKGNKFKK